MIGPGKVIIQKTMKGQKGRTTRQELKRPFKWSDVSQSLRYSSIASSCTNRREGSFARQCIKKPTLSVLA